MSTTSAKISAARLYLILCSLTFSKNKKIFYSSLRNKKLSQIFRKEARKGKNSWAQLFHEKSKQS
jgi:hypothetical protein